MIRLIPIFFLLLLAFGCSDGNDGGPDITEAHPDNWIFTHGDPALRDPDRCRSCHGAHFEGRDEAIGCSVCHVFGTDRQIAGFFTVHPPSWGENVILNHQTFPRDFNWTTCANGGCHGTELKGGMAGPSCFLARCHPQGPPVPNNGFLPFDHPIPFALARQHGPFAQDNLFYCFNCHGRPQAVFDGGYVSDPAILGKPSGNCSLCHPAARAHPTNWQGTNDLPGRNLDPSYTSSHRGVDAPEIPRGCALCHNVATPGEGPIPRSPSCLTPSFTNADGVTTGCHPMGP